MSLGSVLFAIFGAPCAAVTILSPLAIMLGMGALIGSIAPALGVLDSPLVRIPLQLFAVSGAAISLYVIWHGRSQHAQSGGEQLTLLEKRKVTAVIWLSIVSLLAVAFEAYAHIFIHGASYF